MNKSTSGHLMAFVTILIWGTTFISTKLLLEGFKPIEILFIRFVMGFLVLWIIYPKPLKIKDRKQEIYFLSAGLCGVTLYYLLENIALTLTLASNVGIIISIAPFFTAILAHIFLEGEKLKSKFFVGFFFAIIGIMLISFNGTVLKLNPVGDILAVIAAIVWAAYSVLTRKISSFQYNTIQTTRRIFFYGLLFMIPVIFFMDFNLDISRFSNSIYLFNILYLGIGASALCFVTWNTAVKYLGAVRTSVYIYLVPVITILTSVIVLHEKITRMAFAGTVLTIFGLFLSEDKVKRRHSSDSDIY